MFKALHRYRLAILFLKMVACASVSCSSQQAVIKNEPAGTNQSALPGITKSEPLKVLLRRRDTADLALDGAVFMDNLGKAAEKASPGLKELVLLSSTGELKVETETYVDVRNPREKNRKPKPEGWKLEPNDFDFLVNWDVNSTEQAKYSTFDSLIIDVKERWKVSKVSDPTVTKTWTCNFTVDGGTEIISTEKTATEQTEKVVAPTRGPILKEIRDFIRAMNAK